MAIYVSVFHIIKPNITWIDQRIAIFVSMLMSNTIESSL